MWIVPVHISEDQTGRTWFYPPQEEQIELLFASLRCRCCITQCDSCAFMYLIVHNKNVYFHRSLYHKRNILKSVRKTFNTHPSFILMESGHNCNSELQGKLEQRKPGFYRDGNRILKFSILYSFVVFCCLSANMDGWLVLPLVHLELEPVKKIQIMI